MLEKTDSMKEREKKILDNGVQRLGWLRQIVRGKLGTRKLSRFCYFHLGMLSRDSFLPLNPDPFQQTESLLHVNTEHFAPARRLTQASNQDHQNVTEATTRSS